MKCDEGRPSCFWCYKVGQPCVYPQSTNQEHTSNSMLVTRRSLLPIASKPQTLKLNLVPGTEKAKKIFELYVVKISDMLVGSFDGEFWTRVVIQRSFAEPAVWHSVAAMTMLAELRLKERTSRMITAETIELHDTAMINYSKAIRFSSLTIASMTHERRESLLIASLIFCLIELILVDLDKAMLHLDAGARLLQDWKKDSLIAQPHQRHAIESFLKPEFEYMRMLPSAHIVGFTQC